MCMRLWMKREEVKLRNLWLARFCGSVLGCPFPVVSFRCKNELIYYDALTWVDGVAYAVCPESFPEERDHAETRNHLRNGRCVGLWDGALRVWTSERAGSAGASGDYHDT